MTYSQAKHSQRLGAFRWRVQNRCYNSTLLADLVSPLSLLEATEEMQRTLPVMAVAAVFETLEAQ